ncbi:MAG: SLBB domain-containing protein [Bacteroidota bacterium]|nr:SLBB domain-containing protein [Bacteroidota bacterium]
MKIITRDKMIYCKTNFKFEFIFILICLVWERNLFSQVTIPYEAEAKKELNKRGISEEELLARLKLKGIDLNSLSNLSPAEAINIQAEIEETIKEIEVEKQLKQSSANKQSAVVRNNQPFKSETNKPIGQVEITDQVGGIQQDSLPNEGQLQTNYGPIEIWGQQIFRNRSIAVYRQANDIKPPDSYILGVGDQVTISIWGLSQLNEVFEINSEGYITPDRMPRIFLKGFPLGKAKDILRNVFQKFYRFNPNQFQIALNYSRTINVNIFGEVFQYGNFTLPAINGVFNALIAAGGPTNIGSVRKIKLIRNGKITLVDVYKFMANPGIEKDFYLENNDVISVPVATKIVGIRGAVVRPMKYELIEGEELNKLIEYSGGLKADAIRKTFQIERFENDKKIIIDVTYEDLIQKKGDVALRNGDIVTIFSIRTQAEDFIYVKGAVRTEASYQYVENMKLEDLLKKIQLTSESNLENAFIKRQNADQTISLIRVNLSKVLSGDSTYNVNLKPKDELTIFRLAYYSSRSYINITGSSRSPGKFLIDPNLDIRLNDIILLSGGLKPETWPVAFLFRSQTEHDKEKQIIRINILEVVNNVNSDQNIFIEPFDSLVILSSLEFDESTFVDIQGAVKQSGRYPYGSGMTLYDLISLSGGFSYFAATNRIEIFRVIIKDNTPTKTVVKSLDVERNLMLQSEQFNFNLEPFDYVVIRNQPEFEFQQIIQVEGEVKYPGPYALLVPNEKLSDVIQRAGGLSPEAFPEGASLLRSFENTGFVILDLKEALKYPDSRFNLILKDQDNIFIPKQKDLVQIIGATNVKELYPEKLIASNNAINVAYFEGKNAKYYVNNFAAGVSEDGDIDKITVEHANGKISKTKRFGFLRFYPKVTKGSIVQVGFKVVKTKSEKKEKKEIDWGKVVADSIAQATAILTLILLVERLD